MFINKYSTLGNFISFEKKCIFLQKSVVKNTKSGIIYM